MDETIIYYGMDELLNTVEFGPVSLEQACNAIDQRFFELEPQYASGEEAIAATTFGFSRSTETFIEISINGPMNIAFRFEHPKGRQFLILQKTYRFQSNITSKGELMERVKKFFTSSDEAYEQYLEGLKK